MTDSGRRQARSFGTVVDRYDRFRPSYPGDAVVWALGARPRPEGRGHGVTGCDILFQPWYVFAAVDAIRELSAGRARARYWRMTEEPEVPLTGGDMTAVVRVGDTVRRSAGPWTPSVHALLRHLRAEGFTQVPEPRGVDEHGREVLSFLEGEAVTYPLPPYVLTDATLTAVARLMRGYHEAASTFAIPAGAVWQWPAHEPQELVCHNDIAPYNLVFDRTAIVGVIDWDLASPGPRRWDLAEAAYRFVPLTGPDNPDVGCPGLAEQSRRLALFCAEYGDVTPADVLEAAIAKECELVEWIVARADAGDPAQQAVLRRGDVAIYQHDIAHLETHRDALA